jgi:hypothetical protein
MRIGQKNGLVYQWAKKGTRPRQPAMNTAACTACGPETFDVLNAELRRILCMRDAQRSPRGSLALIRGTCFASLPKLVMNPDE